MAPQREWFEKDYYEALGVSSTATAKEITSAYRKLARKSHPDANPGDLKAEERFKKISAAYDVIGNESKRAEYDEVRKLAASGAGPDGFPGGGGGGFGPGGMRFDSGDVGDLGDLLGGLFNRGGGGGGSGRRRQPTKGADLVTDVYLSFEDAAHGLTTGVQLSNEAPCPDCAGSGAAKGTQPRVCPDCAGTGVTQEDQGLFGFSRPCASCNGSGSLIDTPCTTCRGIGRVRKPQEVRIRIPSGVSDGDTIRAAGKGEPSPGGRPGDLMVRVHVASHPRFTRDGLNLRLVEPISITDAALGSKLRVSTLDGTNVTLRIPEGTPTNKTFRVKGRGIETTKSTGDLLVTVEVETPTDLTAEQRDLLEQLDATLKSTRNSETNGS